MTILNFLFTLFKKNPLKNGKYVDHGNISYYKNGKLHRDYDQPAVIFKNGGKQWYKNGELHREHGPAFIFNGENQEWYLDGQRHCETGPARVYPGHFVEWHLFGKRYTEEEFNDLVPKFKLHDKLQNNLVHINTAKIKTFKI